MKIMDLLQGSLRADEDRRSFLRTQVIFWLLVAIDGHAKNFSLFLLPQGDYELTPRYDVLSAHPVIGHGRGKLSAQKATLAMAVLGKNRYYRIAEILECAPSSPTSSTRHPGSWMKCALRFLSPSRNRSPRRS